MGKKRKAASLNSRSTNAIRGAADAQLRLHTFEDAADSEDDFHLNRDKVLLEEEPAMKRRRQQNEDGAPSAPEKWASIRR
jgi:U3 small nucleolar RNA-associated protein 3